VARSHSPFLECAYPSVVDAFPPLGQAFSLLNHSIPGRSDIISFSTEVLKVSVVALVTQEFIYGMRCKLATALWGIIRCFATVYFATEKLAARQQTSDQS